MDLSKILDMPSGDVKFPKVPPGSYVGVVMGLPRYDASTKKGTKFVEFQVKFFEALDDVDPDELDDYGSIADVQMPITFYYETEGGYRRLVKFLEDAQVEEGGTLRQRIEELSGKTVGVVVKHEMGEMSSRAKIDGSFKPE